MILIVECRLHMECKSIWLCIEQQSQEKKKKNTLSSKLQKEEG